jgi:chromosome segregation ATPase
LSKRVEPEIPTINIDQDQVKMARDPSAKAQKPNNVPVAKNQKKSSSFAQTLLMLMPYVALAGTGWYFYQQQLTVNHVLETSSQRIQQLENQLSATGEEMGESTVALKIKLEAISEKTELLLSEMDKLWASAWRKNQTEIKELNSQSKKIALQQTKNTNAVSDLNNKVTETEFSISSVAEQMNVVNNLKADVRSLTSQLSTLDANDKSRDKQQMFTATSLNEFDTSLQLMLERIERIEAKVSKSVSSVSKP